MKNNDLKQPIMLYYFGVLSMLFLIGCISIVSFWLFYPYQTVVHLDDSYRVLDEYVYSGESVSLYLHACRYTEIAPKVYRSLSNGIVINYAIAEGTHISGFLGCYNRTLLIHIPEYVPSGDYILSTNLEFEMNPLRKIVNNYQTNRFKIINQQD